MKKRKQKEPPLHELFAALADQTRLQLVGLLAQQDLCVCDLVDSLGDPQPKISRHLAYLRRAGIVTAERHGKWIRYALQRPLPTVLELVLPRLRDHAVRPAHASPACCPEIGCEAAASPLVTPLWPSGSTAVRTGSNPRVLFLGTRNAARSQMAEGLLRHMAGRRFDVCSAGVEPSKVHPLAVEVMREIGIDISQQTSKTIEAFRDQHFEYVFGVCDRWNERCPDFPSCDEHALLAVRDPATVDGTDGERLAAFREVRDELRHRLEPALWV